MYELFPCTGNRKGALQNVSGKNARPCCRPLTNFQSLYLSPQLKMVVPYQPLHAMNEHHYRARVNVKFPLAIKCSPAASL